MRKQPLQARRGYSLLCSHFADLTSSCPSLDSYRLSVDRTQTYREVEVHESSEVETTGW